MKICSLASLLLLFLLLGTVHALPVYAAEAWSLLGADSDAPLSMAQRREIARDLTVRLQTLRSRVPLQAPNEAEAVRQQLASLGDLTLASEQRGRFFLSLPYQHYQLVELLDGASAELDCIEGAHNEAAEHTCWARLATIYLSEERLGLGISTLRAAKRLPRDDDLPRAAQDPRVWYSEFGRGILRRIITPWLAAQAAVPQAIGDNP